MSKCSGIVLSTKFLITCPVVQVEHHTTHTHARARTRPVSSSLSSPAERRPPGQLNHRESCLQISECDRIRSQLLVQVLQCRSTKFLPTCTQEHIDFNISLRTDSCQIDQCRANFDEAFQVVGRVHVYCAQTCPLTSCAFWSCTHREHADGDEEGRGIQKYVEVHRSHDGVDPTSLCKDNWSFSNSPSITRNERIGNTARGEIHDNAIPAHPFSDERMHCLNSPVAKHRRTESCIQLFWIWDGLSDNGITQRRKK